MIAAEQHLAQGKAKMAAHVAGGVQRRECPAGKDKVLTMVQVLIRSKNQIKAFTAALKPLRGKLLHHRAAARAGVSEGQNRGRVAGGQGGHKGGMIQMRVRDQDGLQPPSGQCGGDGGKMAGQGGARVDQHAGAIALYQIAVGAAAGHGRRIGRAQAGHAAGQGAGHGRRGFPLGAMTASLAAMRFRLKTLLPRSLFGRAALILVVPIVAVQLIVSITFIQRHFEGVTRQMTQGVLIEMDYLLAAVNGAADLTQARKRAADIAGALQFDVTLPVAQSDIPAMDSRTVLDWSGREIIVTLRAGLARVLALDLTTNSRTLQVYVDTNHGPMRLVLVRTRVSASNPHQLLVWMVFTSALMTVIAYVFMRNQLTPITRLAEAAEAFGKGQTEPYRPRGATEVRAAGNAFLDMRARIERQIESRTLMLSGVSHDLRTPLTRLKLGLAFLPEDDETAALQRDVADMERLVDEFLAFARGDAMEAPEPVDPGDLVRRAVENAKRAGQVVTLGAVDNPGLVRLRPQAVMRAVENLIGNAVRFGKSAEVSLSVSDRMIKLVVEDDGPGIPREQREEAMVPFKRLDAARDPNRGGGVGLGLSIAADIARSHGGALWLGESERLGGLRAELTLAR